MHQPVHADAFGPALVASLNSNLTSTERRGLLV